MPSLASGKFTHMALSALSVTKTIMAIVCYMHKLTDYTSYNQYAIHILVKSTVPVCNLVAKHKLEW